MSITGTVSENHQDLEAGLERMKKRKDNDEIIAKNTVTILDKLYCEMIETWNHSRKPHKVG